MIYGFYFLIKTTDKYIWIYLLLLAIIPFLSLVFPDLIFGGIRSTMTRYFFPSYLAIYLTMGYTLGKKNQNKSKIWSIILTIIFTLSIISNIISTNAKTWWNKAPSYHNYTIAQIINQTEKPLLITEDFDINKGNIISLSHYLKSDISLQLIGVNTPLIPHQEYNNIYVFNPSSEFKHKIENIYQRQLIPTYVSLYKLI